MFGKKGELSTQQIIMLIILIASFVVILIFLFRLNLGKESDQEVCHNSVVLRSSSALPSESTPLKCYTDYVCVTEDGNCGDMVNPTTEKVKTEDELYNVLAEQMANCWWMFGAGTMNYVGDDLTKNNYCSICSQIYFDNSLTNIDAFSDGVISKDNLYYYLANNEYSEGETYAQYIFGTNDIDLLKDQISNAENNTWNVATFGEINVGERYLTVMGITSQVSFLKWAGVGSGAGAVLSGVVAFVVLSNPVGWVGGAIIAGGAVVGGVVGGTGGTSVAESVNLEIAAIPVKGNGVDNLFMAPTIVKADSEAFDSLNCEDVLTLG